MSSAMCQAYFLSLDVLIHRGREKKTNDILQMTHFSEWKYQYLYWNFTEIHYGCSVDNNSALV